MIGVMADPKTDFQQNGYSVLPRFLDDELRQRLLKHVLERGKDTADFADDKQVPGTPAIYGDRVIDRLLARLAPTVGAIVGLQLLPTYSYFRVYRPGDTLPKHVDRPSCQISLTLSLGYDAPAPWPIWFGATAVASTALTLAPGDAAVYRGMDILHWRDAFTGAYAAQAFLHYVDQNGPYSEWKFDKRQGLTL